ncbi:hypothetical protein MZV51_27865 [Escherichia coli]|nr:hypothetical protein [Escherichia coli]
MQGAAEKR